MVGTDISEAEIDGRPSHAFVPLVEKIQKKITSWQHLSLSPAGRLHFINGILAALCSNVLAFFLIPKLIAKCPVCQKEKETEEHIFRDCWIASMIWRACSLGIKVDSTVTISLQEWVKNFLNFFWCEDGKESGRAMEFVVVLWAMWTHRNSILFKGGKVNPNFILQNVIDLRKMAYNAIEERRKVEHRLKRFNTQGQNSLQQHQLCITGTLGAYSAVITVDGAWKVNKKDAKVEAAIGWTIEVNGEPVCEGGCRVLAQNAHQTEALALLTGLKEAKSRGISDVILRTDCSNVVTSIKSYPYCRMEVATLCYDIISLESTMANVVIIKC